MIKYDIYLTLVLFGRKIVDMQQITQEELICEIVSRKRCIACTMVGRYRPIGLRGRLVVMLHWLTMKLMPKEFTTQYGVFVNLRCTNGIIDVQGSDGEFHHCDPMSLAKMDIFIVYEKRLTYAVADVEDHIAELDRGRRIPFRDGTRRMASNLSA